MEHDAGTAVVRRHSCGMTTDAHPLLDPAAGEDALGASPEAARDRVQRALRKQAYFRALNVLPRKH